MTFQFLEVDPDDKMLYVIAFTDTIDEFTVFEK